MAKRKSFPNNSRQQLVQRKQAQHRNNVQICVVTEGSVTEKEYLEAWLDQIRSPKRKQIEIIPWETGTDPNSVYNDALKQKTIFPNACMFIMIDEDDRTAKNKGKIKNVIANCNLPVDGDVDPEKINCIYSNRSFDYWGLLHFKDTNCPALDKRKLRKELQHPDCLGEAYDPDNKNKNGKGKRFNLQDLQEKGSELDAFKRAKKFRKLGNPLDRSVTNADELLTYMKRFLSR
ncbi:MAG: RloB family protein [Alphaproteobacteria bacterium]|nr:RloB family protein [Alphaproteobacteria bacterium]MCL2890002.1 RloB family protein [Alphaproteobacteria bacterium]